MTALPRRIPAPCCPACRFGQPCPCDGAGLSDAEATAAAGALLRTALTASAAGPAMLALGATLPAGFQFEGEAREALEACAARWPAARPYLGGR